MAPTDISAYFPPLDKCLSGSSHLISWKTAYRALCDLSSASENSALEAFLTDPESFFFLWNAPDPFLRPGSKTKADFDTKTAPIHVSQASGGEYDVEQLKRDALWLSQQVEVEELVALRIVILEWQQRAQDQLIAATTNPGPAAGARAQQELAGSTLGLSTSRLGASTNGASTPAIDFGVEDVRRHRQLQIYLEEKSAILKISTALVNQVAAKDLPITTCRWIQDLAARVTKDLCRTNDATTRETFCETLLRTVDSRLDIMLDPSKCREIWKSDDAKATAFESACFVDITSTLRLLLANDYLGNESVSHGHAVVSAWFKLMTKTNFFQNVVPSPTLPNVDPLQSLASVISVSMLNLSGAIGDLYGSVSTSTSGSVQYPNLAGAGAYYTNESCFREINLILYNAAREKLFVASPAIYAWSIILAYLKDIANQLRETREQQQEESSDSELVSRRRASKRDSMDDLSGVEKLYMHCQDFELEAEAREDPATFFAQVSVDGTISLIPNLSAVLSTSFAWEIEEATSFFGRAVLLGLLRQGMVLLTYSAELLEAVLGLLAPETCGRSINLDASLVDVFFNRQEDFSSMLLEEALARYPFELTPYLRLLTAMAQGSSTRLLEMLENTPSLTVMVPEDFRDYALEHEDENMNSMMITEPIPLFAKKQALEYGVNSGRLALTQGEEGEQNSNVLSIPAHAPGIVVKESRPLVFRLEHPHSALEYLSLLLSTVRPNSQFATLPFAELLDLSAAADIVSLVTALLKGSLKQPHGVEEARRILGRLSFSLDQEEDIVSVIGDVFEMELLSHLDQSARPGSLEVLLGCAEFMDVLTTIAPERVWSILARSSLLGLASSATALAAVVAGTEVQTGRFRFLAACATLFSSLIDNAVCGLIKRRAEIGKVANRFDSPVDFQDTTPERTMIAVINAFQTVIVDAWQNLADWRFVVRSEKAEIITTIVQTFERLIVSAFGVENKASGENKVSALLQPAAKSLLEAFTGKSANGSTLQAFGAVFEIGYALSDEHLSVNDRKDVIGQINAANRLLTTVLRAYRMSNERINADRKSDKRTSDDQTSHKQTAHNEMREMDAKVAARVGADLLKLTPSLAYLTAAHHSVKLTSSNFLSELVQSINTTADSDPPSLLSQLSTQAGKGFLTVVTQLDQPLNDLDTECAMWNFLSTVMTSKQQWFAIYLLTGALPKDRVKGSSSRRSKSLLKHALDQLSDIHNLAPERAMAMLKFVSAAQSTWVWATNEVRSHQDFLKNTLVWLHALSPPARANPAEEVLGAQEHQMAAYLCDILAVNLHASREVGDTTVLKALILAKQAQSGQQYSRLDFLKQHACAVDGYNRSLHRNLAENFSKKFKGCNVADFARTTANLASYGRDYFYDTELAGHILGHEAAWRGVDSTGRQHGFANEFAIANVNLSLVDAQRKLLKSWRALATILSESITGEAKLQEEMAQTSMRCLQANSTANLDVPGMDEVVSIRADMAFVIISKLISAKVVVRDMKALLPAAWDLVRSSPVDYDVATVAEDLRYYRTLLQILYLTIQPYAYMKPERPGDSTPVTLASPQTSLATGETTLEYLNPNIAAIFVEILAKTIAPGFRALCGNLHNSIELATPADFVLLTAILRAMLSVHGIDSVHPQLANVIASTSLIRGALSLYSWSDQLAEVMGQDPVYGEVAAMFLVALSTLPPVAEEMARDGVVLQLSSANLSSYFRKIGGKGPFDEPKRMFSIWVEAFLPLCLNMLDAVGPAIAADVASFLNEFQEQLHRAETSLENVAPSLRNPHAGAVTLGLVSEAHALCVIGFILESDTMRGAAEGINPADVPRLGFDYRKVKDDAAGLMRQKTSLRSRIVAVGEREEEWKGTDGGGGSENLLQRRIVNEIQALMDGLRDAS